VSASCSPGYFVEEVVGGAGTEGVTSLTALGDRETFDMFVEKLAGDRRAGSSRLLTTSGGSSRCGRVPRQGTFRAPAERGRSRIP
jgi:hypothetical protein